MQDGRLELDDDGRVISDVGSVGPDVALPVDLAAAPGDVLVDGTDGDVVARASRAARRHPVVAGLLGVGVLVLAVTGLVQGLRPEPPPPLRATVEPVGLEQQTAPRAPLVGDYRLTSSTPVRGVGLVGPGVRASTAVVADDGALEIAAVPDCDDPSSLDVRGPASYGVQLDAGAQSAVVTLPREGVDWGSALRRACWLQRAAEGLAVIDVATRADRYDRWLVLDLGLANSTGRPLQARSLDVADIAAIEDADVAAVADGGEARLDVRLPVTRCSAGSLGAQTTVPWRVSLSVGPVGAAPVTVVSLDLSRVQRAVIAEAVAQRCGEAPPVDVRVLAATPVPPSDVLTDTTAAGVDLRLLVEAGAGSVTLGETGTGFTADSRREFTSGVVSPGRSITLRWNARCSSTAMPVLPVTVERAGVTWTLSSRLDDPRVAEARKAACAQRVRA